MNPILGAYGLSLTTTGSGGTGGPIIGLANKCIDVPNSNSTTAPACSCGTATAPTRRVDLHVGRHRARLRQVHGRGLGLHANGTAIQLVTCNGNPAQQFILSGAGDLVNPQANKCVDVSNGNSASGTPLQLWECNGTSAQKWRR